MGRMLEEEGEKKTRSPMFQMDMIAKKGGEGEDKILIASDGQDG